MWNKAWNQAFETRDPQVVTSVLPEILSAASSTSNLQERAYSLLAAATCYAILGDQTLARRTLDEAKTVAITGDRIFEAHADFQEALYRGSQGHSQASLEILDRVLTEYAQELKQPELRYLYEQALFSKGISLAQLRRCDEARQFLTKARDFDLAHHDRAVLEFHLGECFLMANEDESALRSFVTAKSIGLGAEWQAMLYYYIGRAHYRLKQYRLAKHELLESEKHLKVGIQAPSAPDLYKLLSYCCLALHQDAEAEMYSRLAKPA